MFIQPTSFIQLNLDNLNLKLSEARVIKGKISKKMTSGGELKKV